MKAEATMVDAVVVIAMEAVMVAVMMTVMMMEMETVGVMIF